MLLHPRISSQFTVIKYVGETYEEKGALECICKTKKKWTNCVQKHSKMETVKRDVTEKIASHFWHL